MADNTMHFRPGIADTDLDRAIRRMVEIGTKVAWDRRIARIEDELRQNPFAAQYLSERYAIETALARVRSYKRRTGRFPSALDLDPEIHRLFAFSGMLVNVYDRLPQRGQNTLAGRLRGGLKDDIGLAPLAFELLIASHLMQKGANVEFHDLQVGGFDFLAIIETIEVEIECKTFSADIGRNVHQRRQAQLGALLHEKLAAALNRDGCIFVDATIHGHLTGNLIGDVASSIAHALETGRDQMDPSPCSVVLHRISADEMPFDPKSRNIRRSDVEGFIETRFGRSNQPLLVLQEPTQGIVFLGIRSSRPDNVVAGMYEQLKRGAMQFSGTRPGLLCAHFLDLTPTSALKFARGAAARRTVWFEPDCDQVIQGQSAVSSCRAVQRTGFSGRNANRNW